MDLNKDNPKYQSIYRTAKELFWKFGIKRVTTEEICREANVSKMTYYRFFPNKTKLAIQILSDTFNESIEKHREIMAKDIPFPEKIRETIQLKFEGTKDISQELIIDIYKNASAEILDFIHDKRDQIILEILEDYKKAQKKGNIRKNIKPAFILYFINKMMEMGSDQQLIKQYDNPQDLIMELTNFFFYGLGVED